MNIYLIGISISFCLYLLLGWLISKRVKDADDFYVAGRNAPVVLITGSMIASYVSTGMFMGDAGEYYSGLFSPMTILATMQVAGYIYGAIFFGRYLRRSRVYTIPEFFGKRFNSNKIKHLATVTSIITMVVYLLSVMQGVGTLMHTITGLDYNVCITLSLVVFAFVSILSGSRGVLITDTIMFCFFTLGLVVATIVITNNAGGWYNAVEKLVNFKEVSGLLSWSGNLKYLYSTGHENILWGIIYGVVWMSVCMVGPWQSSRYLMAKNEHVVIRSAIYSAFGIFLLQLLIGISAVSVNLFYPKISSASQVMIWASINILPPVLGVFLLTGVLAAGISSTTTFLSLIGSSVANDIFRDKKNSILIARVSMIVVSIVVLLLAIFNPPQIFWIMFFGGAIVASSWMPVAIASIISKRVSKAGAFMGMLVGFLGCFFVKIYSFITGVTLPIYLDGTVVGMVLNVIAIVIGSALTQVTQEEIDARNQLFIVPQSEKNEHDVRVTLKYLKFSLFLGFIIFVVLLLSWVIPVFNSVK